jgi:hypothetical protein
MGDGVLQLNVHMDSDKFVIRLIEFSGARTQRAFDVQTLGCVIAPVPAGGMLYPLSVYDNGRLPFQTAAATTIGRVLRACRSKKMTPYFIPIEPTGPQKDIASMSDADIRQCCDTHYQFLDNSGLFVLQYGPVHHYVLRIRELESLLHLGYSLVYSQTRDHTLKMPDFGTMPPENDRNDDPGHPYIEGF